MPRAFGYVRVSTEQQADSGLGLDAQQNSIESASARLRCDLVTTHIGSRNITSTYMGRTRRAVSPCAIGVESFGPGTRVGIGV